MKTPGRLGRRRSVGAAGWGTIAAWTIALGAAVRIAYRRDTERV